MHFRDTLSKEPRIKLTKSLLVSSRIPEDLWLCDIDNIPSNLPFKSTLQSFINNIHLSEKEGQSLYLQGPYGSGKSGTAVAIIKHVLVRGGRSIFVASVELDSIFGKANDFKLKNDILNTHFLILDDLGAEKPIPWSPPWIEQIIKLRNNKKLPTIITSNDSFIDTCTRIQSITSILGSKYQLIELKGIDWRLDPPTLQKHREFKI